jgi:hypothetical protein
MYSWSGKITYCKAKQSLSISDSSQISKNKNYKIYKELLLKSFDEFDEITAYKSIKKIFLLIFNCF